jgi:hypothetical protein
MQLAIGNKPLEIPISTFEFAREVGGRSSGMVVVVVGGLGVPESGVRSPGFSSGPKSQKPARTATWKWPM